MKATFPRILGINLVIILGVTVALRIQAESSTDEIKGLGFVIQLAFAIFVQFFLNALLGLLARSESVKQSFWMAAMITFLVGFGTCVGVESSF